MPELATKADLLAMEQELRVGIRVSFRALETELRAYKSCASPFGSALCWRFGLWSLRSS
jgi:hypothetical protein